MLLETLKDLCALPGVSGQEDEVRGYIRSRCAGLADEIITDNMGNLLIRKRAADGASAPSLMLCAHMDEVGVIITSITDGGELKFDFVGGVDRRVVIGKRVYIGKKRLTGVIGVKAHHLLKGDEGKKTPKTDALYIDIGAANREEAERLVELGDTGTFEGGFLEFGDGFAASKAIDDRFGCAVLLELLETISGGASLPGGAANSDGTVLPNGANLPNDANLPNAADLPSDEGLPFDLWFAFTVQEEVGARGAVTAANRVKPGACIVVEATTAADLPGVPDGKQICRLGGGAVVPFMDKGTLYDRELTAELNGIAAANGIKTQTKTYIAGGTDASAVQRGGTGVKTAAVSVPLRNIHSPVCVAKKSDMDGAYNLVRAYLTKAGARWRA